MSLDAWGADEPDPAYEAGYVKGRESGWDDALERVAAMLEGMIGSGQQDTQVSARAIAMTVRSLLQDEM